MACESQQAALDAAADNYDAVILLEQANQLEAQQIAMQKMAAMGQLNMAMWLLMNCLNNLSNGLMAASQFEMPEIPSTSELLRFQQEDLPKILKERRLRRAAEK